MEPIVERRIAAILEWPRPDGITWEVHHNSRTQAIWLAMRCGEMGHAHQVKGEPDDAGRLAALQVAEALKREWAAELERRRAISGQTPHGEGPIEDDVSWPDWLVRTIHRTHYLGLINGLSAGLRARAFSLLFGVEVDDIHAPDVIATREGTLRFTWQHHKKCVSIEVKDAKTIEVLNWTNEQLLVRETYNSKFIEHVRASIAWIFPEANAYHATPDL